MLRFMLLTQLGQHIEVLLKEQASNTQTIDTMIERIKTLIATVCLRILPMPVMNLLSFSTYALITQPDATHHPSNGGKSSTSSNQKDILLLSIVPIKASPLVTWKEMLIHLDFSRKTTIKSVFSNHLLRTSVFMVKELVASLF